MDVLTLRRVTLLGCALAACSPKPLRVIEDADGADASDAGDGGPPTPTSCAANPSRADCVTVPVRPSGSFCIGVPLTPSNVAWSASPPVCGLSLSPYFVDATEVTVARFRVFKARWDAGSLPTSIDARFANGGVFHAVLPPRLSMDDWNPALTGCTWTDSPGGARERQPINCVSWAMAMYYCAWEGGHLLTSTEYEYVARWRDDSTGVGRAYPWGEARPSCLLAQFSPCEGDDGLRTRRVGSLSAGASGGVFDLAGNVAEFVADDYAPYPLLEASECWTRSRLDPLCHPTYGGAHFARGSSATNPSDLVMYTYYRPVAMNMAPSPARGLRCAYLAR